jgi:hypothetical protein
MEDTIKNLLALEPASDDPVEYQKLAEQYFAEMRRMNEQMAKDRQESARLSIEIRSMLDQLKKAA